MLQGSEKEKASQKMKTFHFVINCVNAKGRDIEAMVDNGRDVSYKTFFKHVSLDEVLGLLPWYAKDSRRGLTIKNDWAVSYSRSRYRNRRCYFLTHSAIEYIFVEG